VRSKPYKRGPAGACSCARRARRLPQWPFSKNSHRKPGRFHACLNWFLCLLSLGAISAVRHPALGRRPGKHAGSGRTGRSSPTCATGSPAPPLMPGIPGGHAAATRFSPAFLRIHNLLRPDQRRRHQRGADRRRVSCGQGMRLTQLHQLEREDVPRLARPVCRLSAAVRNTPTPPGRAHSLRRTTARRGVSRRSAKEGSFPWCAAEKAVSLRLWPGRRTGSRRPLGQPLRPASPPGRSL
jgi:hypothetical protein